MNFTHIVFFTPFISKYNLKGCFGKLIKSHGEFNSAICVFYKKNPIISNQDKIVMFLISDAIEIEGRRWQVQNDLEEQNLMLNKINSRLYDNLLGAFSTNYGLIVLGKNEAFGRALWEIGYQLQKVLS